MIFFLFGRFLFCAIISCLIVSFCVYLCKDTIGSVRMSYKKRKEEGSTMFEINTASVDYRDCPYQRNWKCQMGIPKDLSPSDTILFCIACNLRMISTELYKMR